MFDEFEQHDENQLIDDEDVQHMYKQYKYILHILHNNNEQIQFDETKEKSLRKKEIFKKKMRTLHKISFSISNS